MRAMRSPDTPSWFLPGLGVALVALYALGIAAPRDPDFDATFGLEAYRALGWGALVGASVVLLAVLVSDRIAAGIEEGGAAVVARIPSKLRVPLLLAVLLTLFLTLTDTSLSGDGLGIVYYTAVGVVYPSNPLNSVIHRDVTSVLGVDPREAIRLVSCVAGVGFAALAVRTAAACFEAPAARVTTTVLLMTAGAAALFFGSLELYAPVTAILLAFLFAGLRWLDGRSGGPWPPLALGLLVTLHGSALVLLPALALLIRQRRDEIRVTRTSLLWAAAFLAPIAAVAASLYWGIWGGEVPPAGPERYGNFLGAQGQAPLLPLTKTPFNVTHRYALLDAEHLVGVANLLFLSGPVGLAFALVGRKRDGRGPFLALVAALLLAFPLVWNVSYAHRRDWDLFATMGVPIALLGALRFLGGPEVRGRAARVTALCLFTFVPLVLSHSGDVRQKRGYAVALAEHYGWLAHDDRPSASMSARLERGAERWRERTTRLDPTGFLERASAAIATAGTDDTRKAEAELRALLREEPGHPALLSALADVLHRTGRDEEARATLETLLAAASESERLRTRILLARMDAAAGRRDAAIRQLERGLREEVNSPQMAVAALQFLAELQREERRFTVAEALERLAAVRKTTGAKQE
jgi:tetratricopeptide (TPR) repeat protein